MRLGARGGRGELPDVAHVAGGDEAAADYSWVAVDYGRPGHQSLEQKGFEIENLSSLIQLLLQKIISPIRFPFRFIPFWLSHTPLPIPLS